MLLAHAIPISYRFPLPKLVVAKSLAEVAAFTVKVVVPDGVDSAAVAENVTASPTSLV